MKVLSNTGIVDIKGESHTIIYRTWHSVVTRCCKGLPAKPTYDNCTIEPDWLYYSKFKAWMETQNYQGKTLDKDILVPGNKHYGPHTCIFVTQAINNLLCRRERDRGPYPIGVSLHKGKNGYTRFVAHLSKYGTQKRLGYYPTAEEAAEAYRLARNIYIRELSNNCHDVVLKNALLLHLQKH